MHCWMIETKFSFVFFFLSFLFPFHSFGLLKNKWVIGLLTSHSLDLANHPLLVSVNLFPEFSLNWLDLESSGFSFLCKKSPGCQHFCCIRLWGMRRPTAVVLVMPGLPAGDVSVVSSAKCSTNIPLGSLSINRWLLHRSIISLGLAKWRYFNSFILHLLAWILLYRTIFLIFFFCSFLERVHRGKAG